MQTKCFVPSLKNMKAAYHVEREGAVNTVTYAEYQNSDGFNIVNDIKVSILRNQADWIYPEFENPVPEEETGQLVFFVELKVNNTLYHISSYSIAGVIERLLNFEHKITPEAISYSSSYSFYEIIRDENIVHRIRV